jgi:hypothetical protein
MGIHIVTPDELVEPRSLIPINDPVDKQFLRKLVRDMSRRGWSGRPLLVVRLGTSRYAFTGSHRIAAAMRAGIMVPVVYWSDYCFELPPLPRYAVMLYLRAARSPCVQNHPYADERVWWLLRMEGQSLIRNGG